MNTIDLENLESINIQFEKKQSDIKEQEIEEEGNIFNSSGENSFERAVQDDLSQLYSSTVEFIFEILIS